MNVDLLLSTFYDGNIPGDLYESCDPEVLELLQTLIKHVEKSEKIIFVDEDDLLIVCFLKFRIYLNSNGRRCTL